MNARAVGTGAGLFGAGILSLMCRLAFAVPALEAPAYTLMGAGLAVFLHGISTRLRGSASFLILVGVAGMFVSAFLLVARRDSVVGIPLALGSLTWTLALLGTAMFSKAATFAPSAAPRVAGKR